MSYALIGQRKQQVISHQYQEIYDVNSVQSSPAVSSFVSNPVYVYVILYMSRIYKYNTDNF